MRKLVPASLVAALLTAACAAPTSAPADGPAPPVLPPAHGVIDYQLGGAYPPAADVRIVTRDRTARPAAGRYGICYVNAFQTQPGATRAFVRAHPDLVLHRSDGTPLADPGWPGEVLLDLSSPEKRQRLAAIVGAWVDGCARSGFPGVEFDNLDSYTRSRGALTRADALAFASLLVARAHAAGLAAGQKNGADIAPVGKRQVGFDFAVTEECQKYHECGDYTRVYGDQVYEIEYADDGPAPFRAACRARGRRISIVYRDRDLSPRGEEGYRFAHC